MFDLKKKQTKKKNHVLKVKEKMLKVESNSDLYYKLL